MGFRIFPASLGPGIHWTLTQSPAETWDKLPGFPRDVGMGFPGGGSMVMEIYGGFSWWLMMINDGSYEFIIPFYSTKSIYIPMVISINGGFHSHGGTPKWMVSKEKYHLEMDDDWGSPISGNRYVDETSSNMCGIWIEHHPTTSYGILWDMNRNNIILWDIFLDTCLQVLAVAKLEYEWNKISIEHHIRGTN